MKNLSLAVVNLTPLDGAATLSRMEIAAVGTGLVILIVIIVLAIIGLFTVLRKIL